MNCLYITSVFPGLSETFIAREIKQLSLEGCDIFIFRLKGFKNKAEKTSTKIHISPVMIGPIYLIRGIIWMLKFNRSELSKMLFEVINSKGKIHTKLKMVSILFIMNIHYSLFNFLLNTL